MNGRVFLDTNILVYAIEAEGPVPGRAACALALTQMPNAVISTQVLGEFYCAVTHSRRETPLTPQQAGGSLRTQAP